MKCKIEEMTQRGHSEKMIRINSQEDVERMVDESLQMNNSLSVDKGEKVKETYEFNGYIVQNG